MGVFRSLLFGLKRYFVGYGVFPFRALYWFGGLVAVGWVLSQSSKAQSVRGWMGLWYSLENALPLIQTTERFKWVNHGRPWLNHVFPVQKVIGFVLSTVLVAALTLLSS